ncbi:MAG TPA: sigma-70 family RNA polymerase sigma factor [Puia sp.]
MERISDNYLINRLKDEKNEDFEALYKSYYPSVRSFVTNKFGSTEDAEDIFQETIVILLQKVRQKDFTLTSSLKTYVVAIAKNLWLKRLRDNRLLPVDAIEKYQQGADLFSIEIRPEKTNEEKVGSWLAKITENCQRILKAIFFYKDAMEIVSKKMGWKNSHTAANQKYKCIEQVKKAKRKSENY